MYKQTTQLIFTLSLGFFPQVSQASTTLNLESVINKTLSAHPSLEAARAKSVAAREAEKASGYLNDPKVSFTWMGQEGPFTNMQGNSSKPSWSISQSFAFPSTWWNMQKSLSHKTEAANIEESWKKSELIFNATRTFWNLALAQKTLSLLKEEKSIIKKHKRNTTLRPVRNELVQAHLLEVDEDLALLENSISLAKAEEFDAYARVLELTGETPPKGKIPQAVFKKQIAFSEMNTETLDQDYRLKRIEALQLSQKAKVSEARSAYAPTLQASFKSLSEDSAMPNAKEFMLGISVPFAYFWQKNAKISMEQAKAKSLDAQYRTLKLRLNADLESNLAKIASTSEAIQRLNSKIIPIAKKRYDLLSKISATDMETLMQKYMAGKKLVHLKKEEMRMLSQIATMNAWVHSFGNASNALSRTTTGDLK